MRVLVLCQCSMAHLDRIWYEQQIILCDPHFLFLSRSLYALTLQFVSMCACNSATIRCWMVGFMTISIPLIPEFVPFLVISLALYSLILSYRFVVTNCQCLVRTEVRLLSGRQSTKCLCEAESGGVFVPRSVLRLFHRTVIHIVMLANCMRLLEYSCIRWKGQ